MYLPRSQTVFNINMKDLDQDPLSSKLISTAMLLVSGSSPVGQMRDVTNLELSSLRYIQINTKAWSLIVY